MATGVADQTSAKDQVKQLTKTFVLVTFKSPKSRIGQEFSSALLDNTGLKIKSFFEDYKNGITGSLEPSECHLHAWEVCEANHFTVQSAKEVLGIR